MYTYSYTDVHPMYFRGCSQGTRVSTDTECHTHWYKGNISYNFNIGVSLDSGCTDYQDTPNDTNMIMIMNVTTIKTIIKIMTLIMIKNVN